MAHPLLEAMLRAQMAALALCHSDTTVEYESDPNVDGRTAIRITGPTKQAVQHQIDKVMNVVDQDGGFANFIGPCRIDRGYGALGEVIVTEFAQAAE